jgi:ATP-dependent Lon protease
MAHASAAAAIASIGEPGGLVVTATTRGLSGEVHERIGCVAEVLRRIEDAPSGEPVYVLHGQARVRIENAIRGESFAEAHVTYLSDESEDDALASALADSARNISIEIVRLMPELPAGAEPLVESVKAPGALADLLAANVAAEIEDKLELLQTTDVPSRIAHVLAMLSRQLEILLMRDRANVWIRAQMEKDARDGHPGFRSDEEKRRYVLRLQQRCLESFVDTDAEHVATTPYRERAADAHTLAEAARTLSAAAPTESAPAWSSLLRVLGVKREPMSQLVEERLAVLRAKQRKDVQREQLKAIDEELSRSSGA